MSRASTNEPEPAIIEEVASFFGAGTYCSRTKQALQRQKKRRLPLVDQIGGLRHDEYVFVK